MLKAVKSCCISTQAKNSTAITSDKLSLMNEPRKWTIMLTGSFSRYFPPLKSLNRYGEKLSIALEFRYDF